jgi:acyl-CoA synthetase (AMP-forming)/AMP-acid ligase II
MINLCQILWDKAKSVPDKTYIYNSVTEGVSYSKAAAIATKLAGYLRCKGHFPGPVLAVILDNAEFLVYIIWACLAAGICLAFLPKNRHIRQTRLLMGQVGADALVTDVPELQALSMHIPFDALETAHTVGHEFDLVAPHTPAFIFQTSGTTGETKWVVVSHGQFLAAIEGLRRAGGLNHAVDQVVYLTPPLSHSYGLSSLLEYSFAGSTIALPRGFSPLGAVGDLREPSLAGSITAIEGVPYFYAQLSKLSGRIKLPKLRHIGYGGGALVPAVFKLLRAAYPVQTCSVRYGMTETPSVVSQKIFVGRDDEDWTSSGTVLPIYDIRIVDETGTIASRGQVGEIYLKGDCLALPYVGEFDNGVDFFATGDLGYVDECQELHVVGRKSVYLESRGFRVSPEYVESVVVLHEGVCDCQALNYNDGLWLNVVPNVSALSAIDLLSFLAERLPGYAVPEKVRFVEAIERTKSGKIRRTLNNTD